MKKPFHNLDCLKPEIGDWEMHTQKKKNLIEQPENISSQILF
jgi:hypothetical protein